MPDPVTIGEKSAEKGNKNARKGKKAHQETGLGIVEVHLRVDEREDGRDGLKDECKSKDR